MLWIGVMMGLGAATSQSLSYLFSRWFVSSPGRGGAQLLVVAHVIQGLIALPLVWWLLPADRPPVSQYILPLLGDTVFYMAGQAGLFIALRHTEASRVAPMLAIKVVLLALLTVTFLGDTLAALQWLAVFMAVSAAWVLNYSGGSIPRKAWAGLLLALTGYALSDFFIRLLIDAMAPVPRIHGGMFGVFCSYVLCGFVGAGLLPWFGSRRRADWVAAMPFALSWFAAMCLFYATIAAVDLVFAGILQSTRGVISVALGVLLARWGMVHLEQKIAAGVMWRRVGAAVLMTAAVIMFVVTKAK